MKMICLSDSVPPRSLYMKAMEKKHSTVRFTTDQPPGLVSVVNTVMVMTHEFLMYHVTEGKMVCYFALQNYLHTWVCSGTSCYSAYKTIKMNAVSNGKPCTLTYQNWLKSCDGFVSLLDIDKSQAFSCPTCGIAPKYFVGDGKCVGPLRKN